jgi:hypothetical protein
MKKYAYAILLLLVTPWALAHNCPNVMKEIDAKLQAPSAKSLPADKLAKIKELRAEGEKQHKAGKHDESMKSLGEANSMLGA